MLLHGHQNQKSKHQHQHFTFVILHLTFEVWYFIFDTLIFTYLWYWYNTVWFSLRYFEVILAIRKCQSVRATIVLGDASACKNDKCQVLGIAGLSLSLPSEKFLEGWHLCNLSYWESRGGFYAKLSNRIQYPIEDIRPWTESQFDNLEKQQHKWKWN